MPKDIFIASLLLFSTVAAFLLGRLSALEEERLAALRIIEPATAVVGVERNIPPIDHARDMGVGIAATGAYVGSKTGKTFHLPWCSGASRIKEENKVWFQSREEAEASGYAPAANCKGI